MMCLATNMELYDTGTLNWLEWESYLNNDSLNVDNKYRVSQKSDWVLNWNNSRNIWPKNESRYLESWNM